MIMPFASRTGTQRNLAALRAAGWGLLISATGEHRDEGFETICIDNGAWTNFQNGSAWDPGLFRSLLTKFGARARFIVAPDIVGGGLESLKLSVSWLPELRAYGRVVLIPAQDGMAPWDIEPYLGPSVGIFVGGSTDEKDPRGGWKLRSLPFWGHLSRRTGCYLHVGRVNSRKRILECVRVGAHSFDGKSASVWSVTLPMLNSARHQTAFALDQGDDQ